MDNLNAALLIDFKTVIISVVTILLAFVFLYELIKKLLNIFGIEFKAQREKREEHEMLIKNAKDITELAKHHEEDAREINKKITDFMTEMRNVITVTQNNVNQYSDNRIHDRQVSIEREKRLNDRIDNMLESDKCRDNVIEDISGGLKKLTEMFVDKQINDYRWEIINFATAISENKPCNKDGFKHCFKTYEKYEKILEDNNLENGEVEISMEIINQAYKEKMLNGF